MKRKRKNFFKNTKNFQKFTKCYSIAQVEEQPSDPIQKPVISGLDKLPSQWKILSKIIEFSKRAFSTVHKQETTGEEKQSYSSWERLWQCLVEGYASVRMKMKVAQLQAEQSNEESISIVER